MDDSDFSLPTASGSRLLSDSPLIFPSHPSFSNTGPSGDDLSLSELSIADQPSSLFSKPFTLLAGPSTPEKPANDEDTSGYGESHVFPEQAAEVDDKTKRKIHEKQREEKLQSDLFILKKLNSAFALFHEALDESGSANERVAVQLDQTDALLNKYIDVLSRSEEFTRLILDEQWMGADADEEELERERREALEKARREAEERALAEQRERERREREEKERAEKEEKERVEQAQQERLAARGSVRGVRGLRPRASVRGTTRAAVGSSTSRLRAPSVSGLETSQTGGTKRYTSTKTTNPSTSIRGSTRRT